MPRLSPSRSRSSVGYEFAASSGFDYNYDPVNGRTSVQGPSKSDFDPYSDDYPPTDDIPSSPQVQSHNSYISYPYKPANSPPRPRSRISTSPPPSPPPASPSPSYLLESAKPSTPLTDPSSSRKLLILDLNGTLVFRSPHRARQPHRPHSYHNGRSGRNSSGAMRTVHPRPYMSAFVSYLFHPSTRTWLDTMIWSSAQPHSVADMVDQCFGKRKDELVAVWARNTFGLKWEDYHRKTPTTKDLAKPWAALVLRPSDSDDLDPFSPTHTRTTTPTPTLQTSSPLHSAPFPNESQPQAQVHSAHTTLLLDDSPIKAHLQPWNHLCIREYDADGWSADLALREYEKRVQRGLQPGTYAVVDENELRPSSSSSHVSMYHSLSEESHLYAESVDDANHGDNNKKHKQSKKMRHKLSSNTNTGGVDIPKVPTYDRTLLAVIGILDALKYESNVAGWMRRGRVRMRVPRTSASTGVSDEMVVQNGQDKAEVVKEATSDVELDMGRHRHDNKRRRISDESAGVGMRDLDTALPKNEGKHRLKSPLSTQSASSPTATSGPGQGTFALPNSDINTPTTAAPQSGPEPIPQEQWYGDPETVSYWAERGILALDELEIKVTGIGGQDAFSFV